MTVETLTDAELNHRIMELMGFYPDVVRAGGHKPDLFPYASSLDALGPVEARLLARGWHMEMHVIGEAQPPEFHVTWYSRWPAMIMPDCVGLAQTTTEARTRAEAAVSALQALVSAAPTPIPASESDVEGR